MRHALLRRERIAPRVVTLAKRGVPARGFMGHPRPAGPHAPVYPRLKMPLGPPFVRREVSEGHFSAWMPPEGSKDETTYVANGSDQYVQWTDLRGPARRST